MHPNLRDMISELLEADQLRFGFHLLDDSTGSISNVLSTYEVNISRLLVRRAYIND